MAIECNNEFKNNKEYFKNILDEITSKKYDKLFYTYLLTLKSDDYDFTNNRPITKLYENMKDLNKSAIIYFFEDLLIKNKDRKITYKANDLFSRFEIFVEQNKFKYEINNIKFGFEIKKIECIESKRESTGKTYIIDFNILKNYLITKNFIKPFEDE